MKKSFILLLIFTISCFGQNSSEFTPKNQVFSFSPISKNVGVVNGIVLGIGHYESTDIIDQQINGINLDINPLGIIALLFIDPEKGMDLGRNLQHNGLHLSLSGYHGNASVNGLGVSLYHFGTNSNGIFINASYNSLDNANGLFISGLAMFTESANGLFVSGIGNNFEFLKGISISVTNRTFELKGLQIGCYNMIKGKNNGLQIGIFNHSKADKGFQLGLWNVSNKRSLPFINW